MAHNQFVRILPDCRKTVVLIHGILGTPDHFSFLLDVIPQDWNVCNLLLDGHGAGPAEFAATSMAKWQTQVSQQLDQIAQYSNRVVIVAHSMGTLLAIRQAIAVNQPDPQDPLGLLAALGGWAIVGKSLRPLQTITDSARDISGGHDLSQRIELEPGKDEVHELADTFKAIPHKESSNAGNMI